MKNSSKRMIDWAQTAIFVLGLLCVGAGAYAVFTTDEDENSNSKAKKKKKPE